MASLADYKVIKANKINLSRDQQETHEFSMDRDMIQRVETSGHGEKRPILILYADPSGNAENLRCRIEINSRGIFEYRYSGGTGRTHSIVIANPYSLRFTERNNIQFICLSGRGTISFSDIVLWYQRWI